MIIKIVNEKGLQEIREFVAENHKQDFFTDEMISAWATDAEDSWGNCGIAQFEIPASKSKNGRTEIYTISDDGLDDQEIDD